jgi:hypothetical protein
MIVTLSERRFSERIREFQNIGPEVSADEIAHRLDKYAEKLFKYLSEFGLSSIGLVGHTGTLGTFQITLEACWDDESRNKRIEGLALLDPLSVTVERNDLRAFYLGILLSTMYDAWPLYSHELQRLTVGELNTALVSIAERIFLKSPTPAADVFQESLTDDARFEMFCRRAGVRVPGAQFRAADEFNQSEIARVEAQRQAEYDNFRKGQAD